jgi:hypothetical protein
VRGLGLKEISAAYGLDRVLGKVETRNKVVRGLPFLTSSIIRPFDHSLSANLDN